ncbi:MAG: VWA domain-containing protein [Myxococcales bacterium]|nr:VWA domain-containing protein [Myxococcales bacterium]
MPFSINLPGSQHGEDDPAQNERRGAPLLGFFYELRRRRIAVGANEWLALYEALARDLHDSSLTGFYNLARAILIHRESDFDSFDEAFAVYFEGIEADALSLTEEIERWLAEEKELLYLSDEERALLQSLSLEELRELLEQRLREQQERHEGGNRWIGTGGTSPFGRGGQHPTGVRIGGGSGSRSAAQVAAERRYRAYRDDVVLDVRQMQVALRKLRDLRRDGRQDELDLDETIDRTCKNAGDLEIIMRAPRRNNVKVILMMDVGGSMDPHTRVMDKLFSAANAAKHFRDFHAFYFHNCVYSAVYKDSWFRERVPVSDLIRQYGENYKLIMVGDALMHPMELLDQGGALDYWTHNTTPGIEWLRRLRSHFRRAVWLNPEPPRYWDHITVRSIRSLFEMFPLTLEGLEDAVSALIKARRRRLVIA